MNESHRWSTPGLRAGLGFALAMAVVLHDGHGWAQSNPEAGDRLARAQAIGRGRALARAYCASCHAVEESGKSPLPMAPPLREAAPGEALDALIGGITSGRDVGHPSMPRMPLSSSQNRDLVVYVQSLQPDRRENGPAPRSLRP